MPGIHSNTIQLHIAIKVDQTWEFLLLHRSVDRDVYPNVWQVVTGKIEDGETAINASIRELGEETGIYNYDGLYTIPYVASFFDPNIDKISLVPVFGIILMNKPVVTLSDEHQNYKWVNFEECLPKLSIPSHREGTRIFKEYILDENDRSMFQLTRENS
jgi:8-oxo-dGTP pyrophosphatase MutT (NUDIX family)